MEGYSEVGNVYMFQFHKVRLKEYQKYSYINKK